MTPSPLQTLKLSLFEKEKGCDNLILELTETDRKKFVEELPSHLCIRVLDDHSLFTKIEILVKKKDTLRTNAVKSFCQKILSSFNIYLR